MNTNSSTEPAQSVCPCFGGRSPVVIYDLTVEFITEFTHIKHVQVGKTNSSSNSARIADHILSYNQRFGLYWSLIYWGSVHEYWRIVISVISLNLLTFTDVSVYLLIYRRHFIIKWCIYPIAWANMRHHTDSKQPQNKQQTAKQT